MLYPTVFIRSVTRSGRTRLNCRMFIPQGLIHYQIMDTSLSWSHLFAKLESIKSSLDIVEDYSLSDTTLEQIFIAFAKGKTSRHETPPTISEL